jgi:hypothetical protein
MSVRPGPWLTALLLLIGTTPAGTAADPPKGDKPATDTLSPAALGLLKDLHGRDPKKRVIAAQDLGKLGESAPYEVPHALTAALLDKSDAVKAAALDSLQKVRPALYKPVSVIVLNRSRDVKKDQADVRRAVLQVGDLGEDGGPAEPLLAWLLTQSFAAKEPNLAQHQTTVCQAVMHTLRKSPPRDGVTFNLMAGLVSPAADPYPPVRRDAMDTLHWLAVHYDRDPKVKDELRKKGYQLYKAALADPDPGCVVQAAGFLGEYEADAQDALPALKRLKLSTNEGVRDAANAAVQKITEAK